MFRKMRMTGLGELVCLNLSGLAVGQVPRLAVGQVPRAIMGIRAHPSLPTVQASQGHSSCQVSGAPVRPLLHPSHAISQTSAGNPRA